MGFCIFVLNKLKFLLGVDVKRLYFFIGKFDFEILLGLSKYCVFFV